MIADTINRKNVEKLLSDLIKIPSPFFREDEVMEYVLKWFKDKDLPAEIHNFHEKKVTNFDGKNIVGSLKGDDEGPKVLLNGHLDTVEICEGWTRSH